MVPSIIGFFHGFYLQSFFVAFKWWLAGSLVAGLVSVPSWPWYLKDTVRWQPLPPVPDAAEEGEAEAAAAEGAPAEDQQPQEAAENRKGGKRGSKK